MNYINMVMSSYSDTVLYLSRILQCMGDKVLVEDMTEDAALYFCIPQVETIDPARNILDYRGMGYTVSKNPKALEGYSGFTTVIRLYDLECLPSIEGQTIIITDEHKLNVDTLMTLGWTRPLRDGGRSDKRETDRENARYLVVRNFTGTIRNQFDEFMVSAGIRRMFSIPVAECDERCAILAMYKDEYRFAGLSKDYVCALIGIMTELRPNIDDRKIMRAYNMAARGKICVG